MDEKVAIYARVSPTVHKKTLSDLHDSLEETIRACTKDSENEGNTVVATYIDEYISGKSSKEMPAFNRMLTDARNKTNTALRGDGKTSWTRIYCRRVNRFGRNRSDMIKAEIELTELGYTLKFTEQGIDTGKPFGKSVMGIMAEQAEEDRKDILINTQRGRERAMAEGVKFGQPKKEINVDALRNARLMPVDKRPTWSECKKMFGATPSTLIKALKDNGYWDLDKRTVK